MYKTLVYFEDLQDNNHAYHEGDVFPREGMEVSKERLKELSSTKNLRGIVLIKDDSQPEKVEETEKVDDLEPKPRKRTSKKK